MIKKGNLLRADRPLEPNKKPPFVPWGSNLIPHYLSTCTEPLVATSTNLIRSENLSSTDESSDVGSKEIKTIETLESSDAGKIPMTLPETPNVNESNQVDQLKLAGSIDKDHLLEVTDFNNSWVRWKGFLKALKRKVLEDSGENTGKLGTLKDFFNKIS